MATIEEMKSMKPASGHREVRIIDDASISTVEKLSSEVDAKRRLFMSQPSTVATRRQQAVCVRRAHKSYGPKSNRNVVLDGLNMTVQKGSM